MGILQILRRHRAGQTAKKDMVFMLYNQLVEAARNPDLYKRYDIPDTLDGRFDCIVLHLSLFMAANDEKTKTEDGLAELPRELCSVFLKDMDRNLREIGVGDLSVGKQVKKMATALYGRADVYGKAVRGKAGRQSLEAALKRNLYRGEKVKATMLKGLAGYAMKTFAALERIPAGDIRKGKIPPAVFRD